MESTRAQLALLKTKTNDAACRQRRGFTLLELLVSISIIAALIALLTPAIQSAREAARKLQCKNHLHNLGIAMIGRAESKERFPASGNFGTNGTDTYHGWPVDLLGWIDQAAIEDRWDNSVAFNSPPNDELRNLYLEVFTCPDDYTAVPGRGNLSYAVNGGIAWTKPFDCPVLLRLTGPGPTGHLPIDLNGNGVVCPPDPGTDGPLSDRKLMFQMGLFFPENWPLGTGTVRHHSLQTIVDGLGTTIMIAENIRSGYDQAHPADTGWASPFTWRNSFFLSGYICDNLDCSEGNVDYSLANSRSDPLARQQAINSGHSQAEGVAPWPTSGHLGGVNVLFADGRVTFLNQKVDGAVYAALLSPQGSDIEGPLRQRLISDGSF